MKKTLSVQELLIKKFKSILIGIILTIAAFASTLVVVTITKPGGFLDTVAFFGIPTFISVMFFLLIESKYKKNNEVDLSNSLLREQKNLERIQIDLIQIRIRVSKNESDALNASAPETDINLLTRCDKDKIERLTEDFSVTQKDVAMLQSQIRELQNCQIRTFGQYLRPSKVKKLQAKS